MNKDFATPEEIIIKLKKLIKKIEQFQKEMGECEITPAQARVIYPIMQRGYGCTMQELVEISDVDKSHVSRVVADLESKGIVERDKKSDSNERNYKILLSEKGCQIFEEKLKQHKLQFEDFRKKFTDEELQNFKTVLNKLIE